MLATPLASVRHRQGKLIGHMEAFGFHIHVLKGSEIEARSSVGMDIGALKAADRLQGFSV